MLAFFRIASFSLLPAVLLAQPVIYPRGVVNVAGYSAAGLPGGSIARGSIFAIFGTGLGPAEGAAAGYPIGAALAGVSITATLGNTAVNVLPLYVSAGQINALMPSAAPQGLVSIQVNNNGRLSNPSPVRVVNVSLGLFSAAGGSQGPGAITNYKSANLRPLNSFTETARPGQPATVYGTGLGPISAPDNSPPPTATLPTRVELWVGGQPAAITYSGRSPCCSGLDQIDFTVPDNAPTGCWVPVIARVAGNIVANSVTMAIHPTGGPCRDAGNPLGTRLIAGGKVGVLRLVRTTVRQDSGVAAMRDVATDLATFDFAALAGQPLAFGSLTSEPPPGACTLLTSQSDVFDGGKFPVISTVTGRLDGGSSIALTGPRGSRTIAPASASLRATALGSFAPFTASLDNQLFLDPGDYTLSGAGADTGSYLARVRVPLPFDWTNRATTNVVDRTKPLTLYWSGGEAYQRLAVMGASIDLPANSSALFYCVAPAGATSFNVPPEILSALPATRPDPLQSKSIIYLTSMPLANAVTFNAAGLDLGLASFVYQLGKTVTFR